MIDAYHREIETVHQREEADRERARQTIAAVYMMEEMRKAAAQAAGEHGDEDEEEEVEEEVVEEDDVEAEDGDTDFVPRHELTLLAEGASGHRRILGEYSPYLLDQMISVVTASTLMAYSFYATSPETAAKLGTDRLSWTIPFVLYGIFRYLYLVHQKRGGGSPAAMLLTDRPLLACVGLWAVCVMLLLYSPLGRGSFLGL